MDSVQINQIELLQRRLDGVQDCISRVPYRSWAYTYWSGVCAYLLRRLNTLINDTDIRERVYVSCSIH